MKTDLGEALFNILWFIPVMIVLAAAYFAIVGYVEHKKDRKKISREAS